MDLLQYHNYQSTTTSLLMSTLRRTLSLRATLGSAALRSPFPAQFPRFMSSNSTPTMDSDVNRIISYWCEAEDPPKKWFAGGPKVDAEIQEQFGALVDKARESQLVSWKEQPRSSVALLILLDQFSRNLFRGSPRAFSSDPVALDIAITSIAKGFHKKVSMMETPFFYLPLIHHESLISQIAGVALYESNLARSAPDSKDTEFTKQGILAAERHRDIIMRFGRFPGRNKALGRDSTPEEIEFLKEHPSGL